MTTLEIVAVLLSLHCNSNLVLGEELELVCLDKPEALTPTLISEIYFAYAFLDVVDLYGLAFEASLANGNDPDQGRWIDVVNGLFPVAMSRA